MNNRPIEGIEVFPAPNPDNKPLAGYQLVDISSKLFVKPQYDKLSLSGWIQTFVLLIVCFPLAFIPACLGRNYPPWQVPVYT